MKDAFLTLNCAGPFIQTAKILMEACIRNATHYLDISADVATYQQTQKYDDDTKRAGVMLLPCCGGSVAMLGCLAAHVVDQVKDPQTIDVAPHVAGAMSRGSAISSSNMTSGCIHLVDGDLVEQDATHAANFDFDDGKRKVTSFPVTLPDLLTISKSSGFSTIRNFAHASGLSFPTEDLAKFADGPTAEEREATPYHAVAVVKSEKEFSKRAVLYTLNGYSFTSLASVEAARRVMKNEIKPGFQTPGLVFGKKKFSAIPKTDIRDL